jgi:hypothetical protein
VDVRLIYEKLTHRAMNSTARNVLAVLGGLVVGSAVNMGIIMLSGSIIPPPEGADVTTTEGLTASMHLFQPRHFIMPFLAHAFGTFMGALVAALLAASQPMRLALGVGVVFMVGGVSSIFMLPSPLWFSVLDVVGAYFPMAYAAGVLVAGMR